MWAELREQKNKRAWALSDSGVPHPHLEALDLSPTRKGPTWPPFDGGIPGQEETSQVERTMFSSHFVCNEATAYLVGRTCLIL